MYSSATVENIQYTNIMSRKDVCVCVYPETCSLDVGESSSFKCNKLVQGCINCALPTNEVCL